MDAIHEMIGYPNFWLFVGLLCVPVMLCVSGRNLLGQDSAYLRLIIGTSLLAIGTCLDFMEDLSFGAFLHDVWFFGLTPGRFAIFAFYLPGIMLVGWGLAQWLPRVQSLNNEIERRQMAEAEIRHLLETSQELARKAEEASQAKTAFLANMSHELRTPLNAILGFTEMLKLDVIADNPEKTGEYHENILKSGRHLLSILSDILDLSKVEAGKIIVQQSDVNLRLLLEECIDYAQQIPQGKGLTWSVDVADIAVSTDERLLKQIVINLLANAVKFTPEGGQITVRAVSLNDGFEITLADTGVGMTPDELKSAMAPFVQVQNSYTKGIEGTGLGLSLVQNFCRLLDGRVVFNSAPGEGTTVVLGFSQIEGRSAA